MTLLNVFSKVFFTRHVLTFSLAGLGLLGLLGTGAASAPMAAAAGGCGTNLECVKAFGDARISERLAALTRLNTAAANHKGLTDQQRDVIEQDVQTNKQGLTALQKKLDAETDVQAARQDVKNIYVQFRIYAVVLPRDYGELYLFHEQNVVARMKNANQKISNLIQKAKEKGKDVSQLLALQSDYNAKLDDATRHLNDAQGLIPQLTPANYPATTDTLKTYRADLKAAHEDIKGAAQDLHQIIQLLKQALQG